MLYLPTRFRAADHRPVHEGGRQRRPCTGPAGVVGLEALLAVLRPCDRTVKHCGDIYITENIGDAWRRVVAIANHDGVVELLLVVFAGAAPLLSKLPRRHRPPPVVAPPPHPDHLRLEADEAEQIEPPRERLQVPEDLLVSGEPAGVLTATARGGEGEVEEPHGLAWHVGAERCVEAAGAAVLMSRRGAERGGGRVEPGTSNGGGALEDDGRVALAA